MNKRFITRTILTTLFLSLFGIGFAYAANLIVDFEYDPLFSEADFKPGDAVVRWVKVSNNSGQTMPIAAEAINVFDDGLGDVLYLEITEDSSTLFDGTLAEFFDEGEYYLSDVANGIQAQYDFSVTFHPEAGNDYQETTLGFDLIVGFQGEGGTPPGGGGGGGTILPPGLVITGEKEIGCDEEPCDTVVIEWNTSFGATSQVIYSSEFESHSLDLGLPNYGYAHAEPVPEDSNRVLLHSVTLTGLQPCTTYYYRAVSHASPPTVGQEQSFTMCCPEEGGPGEEIPPPPTGGTIVPPEGGPGPISPPEEIPPIPEEEEIPEIPLEASAGSIFLASLRDILGDFGNHCYPCLPWWVIFILSAFSLFEALMKKNRRNKRKMVKWIIWAGLTAILAVVFYLIKYYCIPIWILILLVLATIIYWRLIIVGKKRNVMEVEKKNLWSKIKKEYPLIAGLIILLIVFIIWLILGCLYLWIIVLAILIYLLIIDFLRGRIK